VTAISPDVAGVIPAQATMLIARIARVVRQRFEHALEPVGLRQRHVVALSYLRGHGPTAQQVLAERLCMDASSTVGLLNYLEDNHLVARGRDRTDRRRALVELTPEGEEALSEVDRVLECVEDQLLLGLDQQERRTLRALLAKLGHNEVDWSTAAEG
jgi:DNA-binding MarR family transcriptional regulator